MNDPEETTIQLQLKKMKHPNANCYVILHQGLKERSLKFKEKGAISPPIPSAIGYEILGEHSQYLTQYYPEQQAEVAAAPRKAAPAAAAPKPAAPARPAAPKTKVVDKLAEQPVGE